MIPVRSGPTALSLPQVVQRSIELQGTGVVQIVLLEEGLEGAKQQCDKPRLQVLRGLVHKYRVGDFTVPLPAWVHGKQIRFRHGPWATESCRSSG